MKRSRIRRAAPKAKDQLVKLRSMVLQKANGRCERCGKWKGYFNLDVHHRRPRSLGGKNTAENAVALCRLCHTAIHDHTAPDWRDWMEINHEDRTEPRTGDLHDGKP